MKEYKLVKWYPSLPKDWKERMIVGTGDRHCSYSPCAGNYTDKLIESSEVEKNPEYWEEVKDYEILSFISDNGTIQTCFNIKYDYPYLLTHWKIHSAKRLSDCRVYTLGDKFRGDKIINKIERYDNTLRVMVDEYNWTKINSIRDVLFTTEDGVEIYEKTKVWYLKKDFSTDIMTWESFNNQTIINDKNYIYFSSKEKAQEYVDLYKPKYSHNDIYNFLKEQESKHNYWYVIFKNLEKLKNDK